MDESTVAAPTCVTCLCPLEPTGREVAPYWSCPWCGVDV